MERVDGQLAVSRALGDFQYKDPVLFAARPDACKVSGVPDLHVQARNLAEDQFIVIACDGIWDVMTNEEVIERVTGYMGGSVGESDPLLLAEELIEDALAKNSRDNMTACVVLFPAAAPLVSGSSASGCCFSCRMLFALALTLRVIRWPVASPGWRAFGGRDRPKRRSEPRRRRGRSRTSGMPAAKATSGDSPSRDARRSSPERGLKGSW